MEFILAIVGGISFLKFSSRFFFTDSNDFMDSLKYWFRPARSRFMFEQWSVEFWREMRFFIWLILGILSGYGIYRFLLA